MEVAEMKEITLKIMKSADNVYDKDAVLAAMFGEGIPFAKLAPLYREVGAENDLIVDGQEAKDRVYEALNDTEIVAFENYEAVLKLAAEVQKEVKNIPEELILKCIRSYFREQEVIIPRKSRPFAPRGSVGSKIVESAINYSFNTPAEDLTRQGLYDAILPHCKHADSAYSKTNSLFPLVFAIANEMNFEAASSKLKELPLLEKEAA